LPDIPDVDWLMGGALIVDVVDEGPADEAGLMVGDIVTAVDGRELDDDWSLADAIGDHDPGDMVALDVTRGHRQRTVEVELGRNPQLGGETPWLGVSYRDMGTLGRGPGDAPRRFELPFPRRRD